MQRFSAFEVDELKLVYRVLHRNLMDEMDLMDTVFLMELQRWLQYRAGQDGIDVANHAQWDAWLGGTHTSCEDRVARRRVLSLVSEENH